MMPLFLLKLKLAKMEWDLKKDPGCGMNIGGRGENGEAV
jgi:hypothetical protein